MPELDVTDVLLDPDFLDMLECDRAIERVGANGLVEFAPELKLKRFMGVVTNDKGAVLRREAEGSRIEGAILVITRFHLSSGKLNGDTRQHRRADVIHWNKRRYTVINVADYTRYGRGFIQANCELIPLSGGV